MARDRHRAIIMNWSMAMNHMNALTVAGLWLLRKSTSSKRYPPPIVTEVPLILLRLKRAARGGYKTGWKWLPEHDLQGTTTRPVQERRGLRSQKRGWQQSPAWESFWAPSSSVVWRRLAKSAEGSQGQGHTRLFKFDRRTHEKKMHRRAHPWGFGELAAHCVD